MAFAVHDSGTRHSALIAAAKTGHLVFSKGVSDTAISDTDSRDHLYMAYFDGDVPNLIVLEGTVDIAFPRIAKRHDSTRGAIRLTRHVPWYIQIQGGAHRIAADLSNLEIKGLRFSSGVKNLTVFLPSPRTQVPIEIVGGARNVKLLLPPNTYCHLEVAMGAADLDFNGQTHQTSGVLQLDANSGRSVPGGYSIYCRSGVRSLSVSENGTTT